MGSRGTTKADALRGLPNRSFGFEVWKNETPTINGVRCVLFWKEERKLAGIVRCVTETGNDDILVSTLAL